jgi:DNA repair protein RadC
LISLVSSAARAENIAVSLALAFESTEQVIDAPASRLHRLRLTGAEIASIAAAREFLRLHHPVTTDSTPVDLGGRWVSLIGGLASEVLEIGLLDASGDVLPHGVIRVHHGTVDRVTIRPRRVMELALGAGAAGVVLGHNHPTGDVTPTRLDIDGTRAVQLAGISLDIAVVDHLVVTRTDAFSFRGEGLL